MDEIAILKMLSPSRLILLASVLTFLYLIRQYLLLFLVLLYQLIEVTFNAVKLDLLSLG